MFHPNHEFHYVAHNMSLLNFNKPGTITIDGVTMPVHVERLSYTLPESLFVFAGLEAIDDNEIAAIQPKPVFDHLEHWKLYIITRFGTFKVGVKKHSEPWVFAGVKHAEIEFESLETIRSVWIEKLIIVDENRQIVYQEDTHKECPSNKFIQICLKVVV